MNTLAYLLLAASATLGCGQPAPGNAAPQEEHVMSHDHARIHWRQHTVAPIGIELDAADGPVIAEGSEADFRYFVQTVQPVRLAARIGKRQDLASWRELYGAPHRAVFGPETATTLCGLPAIRQEVVVDESRATGGFVGDKGQIVERDATEPAMVHVAEAAVLRGQPLLVVWSVERSHREAYRDDEAHFFASVRCP